MQTYNDYHLKRDLEKKRLTSMRRTFLSKKARNDEVVIDFARTATDMERTFRLVGERYCEAGYLCPKRNRLWLTVYHALPETRILSAHPEEDPAELLITATIVHDSLIGLPSEKLYPQEIMTLKEGGRHVAEVCSLARSRHERADYSFMKVVRLIILYGQASGIDDFVISVNPAHAPFYINSLLFEEFGEQREYPNLTQAPAVLLRLDMRRYQSVLHQAYQNAMPEYNLAHYFFDRTSENIEALNVINRLLNHGAGKRILSVAKLCDWLLFETDTWQNLPERKRKHLNTLYPGLEEHFFSRIS